MTKPLSIAEAVDALSRHQELFLGPACVTGVRGLMPEVELPDGTTALAQMALAFPYNFALGDRLLVVGRGDAHYVIGVLESRGDVSLRFQGNVSVHAVGGTLRLVGDEGVTVRSPVIELQARRMKLWAESLSQKCGELIQTVRETLHLRAGEKHEHIVGASQLQAERHSVLTEGVVTINGKEVHLG